MRALRYALAFLLVAAFALCASPLPAQDSARVVPVPLTASPRQEPAVQPGTVRVRWANAYDCPIAVRVTNGGKVVGVAVIPPRALEWGHFAPGERVIEVDILASPRLCGMPVPGVDSASAPPVVRPGVQRAALFRRW